ncbi:hypothetical protein AB0I89_30575 [Micromonospora sp. NPDC049801]|uniref:hypothetical protein n=1 Tax=unclassified Micromonospora TaxID=2617518 RepID=UPI0033DE9878
MEAEAAMRTAAPAGHMLIAGGHLDRHPVVLIAGAAHCEITTISGAKALRTEENLNALPGAALATSFTVYLPAPDPHKQVVADAVAGHACLSDEAPPAPDKTPASGALVDAEALRKAVAGR